MTAEIVVMNKHGVAIAADSAVTVGDGYETYNDANKLFSLSKYAPVAIMIYNNASLIGVPWEVIIKIYRSNIGDKKYKRVIDYMDNFIAFVNGNLDLFPLDARREYVRTACLHHIKVTLNQFRDEFFSDEHSKDFNEFSEKIFKKADVDSFTIDDLDDDFLDCWDDLFDEVHPYFGIMNDGNKSSFKKLIKKSILNDKFALGHTGVVVAGFGEDEFFPSVVDVTVGLFWGNGLHVSDIRTAEVSHTRPAEILPFAQKDMVEGFMRGVHPLYDGELNKIIIQEYSGFAIELISRMTANMKEQDLKKVLSDTSALLEESIVKIADGAKNISTRGFVLPVYGAIMHLSKEQLAKVAESLVNLTSFKKQVSIGDKSVGGEIDVAVISKGDGLIWIKRKHYFLAEKNQHFFANYYNK